MRRSRYLAGLLAATMLLGGCSAQDGRDRSDRAEGDPAEDVRRHVEDVADAGGPAYDTYVALGDSFTAGPLVPHTDLAQGCFRSNGNYPSIVAERLDVDRFVDVSCSGAATEHLTRRQETVRGASVPPQLRALTPDTDLVTLGIGGNDFRLFHTLVSTCTRLSSPEAEGAPCRESLEDRGIDLVGGTQQISVRVERAVRTIRARAPEAEVVVVGYMRLAPASGRCEELPFADGDYEFGLEVTRALNAALERAARRTGVEFVDMHEASEGHDVCSDEPWVNGVRTVEGEAAAYHPFAAGMEATADLVVEAVER